jgi:putative DNA primase/helicase
MGSQLSDRIVDVHGISPIVQAQKGGVVGVKDRAGWWTRNDEGKLLYLFTAGGLREALKGHDFEAALKVLASVGALPPPNAKGEWRA